MNIKLGIFLSAVLLGLSGCVSSKMNVDQNTTSEFDVFFDKYKTYNAKKAIAMAIDKDGKYAYGYAYGYPTKISVVKRAIEECEKNKIKHNVDTKAECKIYALGNKIMKQN